MTQPSDRHLSPTQSDILDALPATIALVERSGVIFAVNEAWRRFAAENGLRMPDFGVGENYLTMCDRATGESEELARETADGIRRVLSRQLSSFVREYPCHSAVEQRWYRLMVSPLHADGAVIMHLDITGQKLAELALRASQRQFEKAFLYAAVGVALIEVDGHFRVVNRSLCNLLGYSEAQLLEKQLPGITYPEDLARTHAICRSLLDGKVRTVNEELRYVHSDGNTIWANLSLSLLRTETGDPAHFIAQFQDLTEQRRASEEVRIQAAMLDQIGQAVIATDITGRITYANRRAAELYGWPRAELLGQDILDVTVPQITRHQGEEILSTLRQGLSWEGEFMVQDRAGRAFPAHVVDSPVMNADGDLVGIIGISTDFSARKRSDELRRQTELRFRRLVESNVQGVAFFTPAGVLTEANDAVLQLLGYTRDDLAAGQLAWAALTPPEYAAVDQQASSDLAEKGVAKPYEKELIRKDGLRIPVLVGSARLDDPEEGVAFVVDLTERKKLEKQFLRAQRLESIGTLAGGIAHDLNNVLTPILMSLEMLGELNPGSENKAILETLELSANRGAELVKQVLSFARGVSGARVTVNLPHLLREVLQVVRDTFPKSIELRLTSVPDPWTVSGDPTQLHQVFMNLCVNARDAMPDGGTLRISVEKMVLDETYAALTHDSRPGAYAMVQVSDTGVGIPAGARDRVFEPFYTTKELGHGTGLGLSTVMAIVKSHHGFINLYSEVGKGTRFKVYLPATATPVSDAQAQSKRADLPLGHGELILVVDDEAGVREIAERTLTKYGYRVKLAANGAEAIAVYAKHQAEIAVVLTDMAMPIMDGPALMVALKTMDPAVRIVGSSGLTSRGGAERAISAGVPQFVAKPYTARALLGAIRDAISGRSSPER